MNPVLGEPVEPRSSRTLFINRENSVGRALPAILEAKAGGQCPRCNRLGHMPFVASLSNHAFRGKVKAAAI